MTATRVAGTRPSVAILYATPIAGTNPDTSGTATLTYGFGTVFISWNNCLCDIGTNSIGPSGQVAVFKIYDRRWSWRKHVITGAYNVRLPDNSVDSSTQKTLAQLITLLFNKIGETVDVSAITSTEYPEVIWDRDVCTDQIDDLLESRGYIVCLNADDSVSISVVNTGAALPANSDVVSVTFSVDPPEVPLYLTAVGSRTMVQSKLKASAVCPDTDGKLKLAKDLSFNPGGVGVSTGWDGVDMVTFAAITDPAAQQLCLQYLGKWFQVTSQGDGTQTLNVGGVNYLPGEITVTDARQYYPLKRSLLTTATNTFGDPQYDVAFVEVTAIDPATKINTADFTRLDRLDWEFNAEHGIIIFKQPLLKYNASKKLTFGDVYVTCSYSVSDATGIKDRFERNLNLGGIGEDTDRREELQRTLVASYTAGTATLASIADNKTTMNSEADLYLNAAALRYSTKNGTMVLYRRIYAFNIDGATLQIVWNCANGGKTPWSTYAAQYCESLPRLPTARSRARLRRIGMTADPNAARIENFNRNKKRVP